jgi:hypothetical protein
VTKKKVLQHCHVLPMLLNSFIIFHMEKASVLIRAIVMKKKVLQHWRVLPILLIPSSLIA